MGMVAARGVTALVEIGPEQEVLGGADDPGDDDLVAAARRDRAAFARLYRRYVDPVHRYCFRRLGSREAAEDAASLVFVKALTSLPRYRDREDGSFRGWLFTIAHRVVVDALRVRGREQTTTLDEADGVSAADPLPEELAVAGEDGRLLREMILRLPEAERQAIELRLAGLTGGEIATVLGKNRTAVDVAQFRAIRRLRALLSVGPTEESRRGRG